MVSNKERIPVAYTNSSKGSLMTLAMILLLITTICLGFLAFSVVTCINVNTKYKAVEGTITRIDTVRRATSRNRGYVNAVSHKVYVDYSIDEKDYPNILLNFYTYRMYEGKSLELRYEESNPYKVVVVEESYFYIVLLLIFSTCFGGVGVILVLKSLKHTKAHKVIQSSRRYYEMAISEVITKNVRVNRVSAKTLILTQTSDSSLPRKLETDSLFVPMERLIERSGIKTVKVYVSEDGKEFYADVLPILNSRRNDK